MCCCCCAHPATSWRSAAKGRFGQKVFRLHTLRFGQTDDFPVEVHTQAQSSWRPEGSPSSAIFSTLTPWAQLATMVLSRHAREWNTCCPQEAPKPLRHRLVAHDVVEPGVRKVKTPMVGFSGCAHSLGAPTHPTKGITRLMITTPRR